MAILRKGSILPIGGALAGEGLPCSLHSRLVFLVVTNQHSGKKNGTSALLLEITELLAERALIMRACEAWVEQRQQA